MLFRCQLVNIHWTEVVLQVLTDTRHMQPMLWSQLRWLESKRECKQCSDGGSEWVKGGDYLSAAPLTNHPNEWRPVWRYFWPDNRRDCWWSPAWTPQLKTTNRQPVSQPTSHQHNNQIDCHHQANLAIGRGSTPDCLESQKKPLHKFQCWFLPF